MTDHPKFKVLKVIVEEQYLIPMIDDTRSSLDGRTLEQIEQEWFRKHDLNSYHATRECHRIGNGRTFIEVKKDES